MSLAILTLPLFKAWDVNGLPLAGGKLYSFAAGTSTPLALLAADGITPLANPVVLNAYGQAQIRLRSAAYKLDLFDALNIHQPDWPVDLIQMGFDTGLLVAVAQVPTVAGATLLTAAGLIPAGARVVTVSTKITTGFGTSGGLTGFSVGDGALMDRWGAAAALTIGALTGSSDAPSSAQVHDSSWLLYPTATSVVLSGIGGTFDAAGAVEVSVQYLLFTHRSA